MATDDKRDKSTATERLIAGLVYLPQGIQLGPITPADLGRMLAQAVIDGAVTAGGDIPPALYQAERATAQAAVAFVRSGTYTAAMGWGPEGRDLEQAAAALGQARLRAGLMPESGAPTVPTCLAKHVTEAIRGVHGSDEAPHTCGRDATHNTEATGSGQAAADAALHHCTVCGFRWT